MKKLMKKEVKRFDSVNTYKTCVCSSVDCTCASSRATITTKEQLTTQQTYTVTTSVN